VNIPPNLIGFVLVGLYPTRHYRQMPRSVRMERRRVLVESLKRGPGGQQIASGIDLDCSRKCRVLVERFADLRIVERLPSDDIAERTHNVEIVDEQGTVRHVPLRMVDESRAKNYCDRYNAGRCPLRARSVLIGKPEMAKGGAA
jgi:hypothetical protein